MARSLYAQGTLALLHQTQPQAPHSLTSTIWGRSGGASTGAWTPSTAKDQISQLNVDYGNLDREIKMKSTSPQFLRGWNDSLSKWMAFYADNQAYLSITPINVDEKLRQTDQYRQVLVGWRGAFAKETGSSPVSPDVVKPPTDNKTAPGYWDSAVDYFREKTKLDIPWWAISGLTVAVIGGIAYVGYSVFKTGQMVHGDTERFKHRVQGAAEEAVGTALVRTHDMAGTGAE
jgi:hypothetical protein